MEKDSSEKPGCPEDSDPGRPSPSGGEGTEDGHGASDRDLRLWFEHTSEALFCYEYDPPVSTDLPVETQVRRLYEGVLVECNRVAARTYGASDPGQVLGRSLSELFQAAPGALDGFFEAFIAGGYQLVDADATEELPDGTRRHFRNSGTGVVEGGELSRIWGAFRDVTDEKLADAALQASEARFRAFMDYLPAVAYIKGPDQRFLTINPAGSSLLGLDPEDIVATTVDELLQEFSEMLQAADDQVLASGKPHPSFEWSLTSQWGKRWLREYKFPIEMPDGTRLLGGIAVDVTEQRRTREQLAAERDRSQLYLDRAEVMLVALDRRGRIEMINRRGAEILGYREEELLGRIWFDDCLPAEARGPTREVFGQLMRGEVEAVEFHENEVETKGGDLRTIAWRNTILRGPDGSIRGTFSSGEDVSGLRESERALRESERRFRELADLLPEAVFESDMDLTILYANQRALQLCGYTEEDLRQGLNGLQMVVPEDHGRVRATLRKRMGGEEVPAMEYTMVRKDGSTVPVLFHAAIIRKDGSPVGVRGLFVDISQRLALEDQLRQAQKMEAVGKLTGGIAHDFNNVLAVILLNAELMADSLENGQEVQREDVRAIEMAAKRASSITSKLLGFSRRAELDVVPVHMGRVVERFAPVLRTLLSEQIQLDMELAGAHSAVMADSGSLEQIVLNLVTNSRDAIPERGEIRIQVSEQTIDEEYSSSRPGMKAGDFVCLQVSDTGEGMDQETLQRIFDPFFTTKALGAGTGLGMAMVYGLTKQQGGYVDVASEEGKGTVTRIYFPVCHEEPAPEAETAPAEAAPSGTGTILLVEDEENLRETAALALRRHGYEVIVAADGEEGLETFVARRGGIDLVFSDLVLPGMNGLDLHRKIVEGHGPVRFILATGYSGAYAGELDRSDSAVPVLHKPWSLHTLLTTVQAAFEAEPRGLEED